MIRLFRRHSPWISAAALGLILIALGSFFLAKGLSVKAQITQGLKDEQVVSSKDARIPNVPVVDAETAKAQADAIKGHTLGTWGPYSQLPKDDPRRAQFIDGVALRTALNLAVLGFGVADLAIGAGAIILIAGLATLVLATPAMYFLAEMVMRRAETAGEKP